MAINQKRNWLIAYDIADPKRLAKIHRLLKKQAIPIQYSLFLYRGTTQKAKQLIEELSTHINNKQDDLRAYPIPSKPEINLIGQPLLLDGILFLGDGVEGIEKFFHNQSK